LLSILKLPHLLNRSELTCRAIIETPAGHRSKFDYDPDSGLFELAGVLPAGMAFPLAFGFVPGTLGEDGDPVDVLVLADEPLPMGCLVTVRLLGVIEAEQTEDGQTCRNDRLVARVQQSSMYADVHEVERMGPAFMSELSQFFVTYNELKGRGFRVISIGDASRASELIAEAELPPTPS
jgi:inorganic pyrophosphatase